MNELAVDIVKFIEMATRLPVIDVRTPAEFEHAHIPGAVNMPLFTNEERSVIGTLYLKKGSDEALSRGLDMIRPKMKDFADAGYRIAGDGEALMHCWRGGMRSRSMAWLMNTVGIKTYTLIGGYKQFRRYTAEVFAKPLNIVVIGGSTGSGKTYVLHELKLLGKQVIDLEGLASHKGSVFGSVGMPVQGSNEQFENNLFAEIIKLNPDLPVFIEDESLSIGNVFVPRPFYSQMSDARFIHLKVSFENRLLRLIDEYTAGSEDLLIAGVKRLEKRLGLEQAAKAELMIRNGDIKSAAALVLNYYDKVYARSMTMHKRHSTYDLEVTNETPEEIARRIIKIQSKWN